MAAVLLAAGSLKLRDPRTFAATIRKLGPWFLWRHVPARGLRLVARAVAAAEVAVAVVLAVATGRARTAALAVAVVLGVGFTVATAVAARRGMSCGCFGSLRTAAAGRKELLRAGSVLAAAAVALALGEPEAPWPPVLRALVVVGGALAAVRIASSPLVRATAPTPPPAPPGPPPIEGAVDRLRAFPEVAEIDAAFAAAGTPLDWSTARASVAGEVVVLSVGVHPGPTLVARMAGGGRPPAVSASAGGLRFVARDGKLRQAPGERPALP